MAIRTIPDEALTHAGRFHADDVFSSALLKLLHPGIRIYRVFKAPDHYVGLVFDLGGGEFDHHQQGAEVRENGVPYAAFGLLWRAFGKRLMEQGDPSLAGEEAVRFDEKFVQPLDEDDNKGTGSAIASVIAMFNPSWDSGESPDVCFDRAVDFAKIILINRLHNIFSIQRAQELVRGALERSEDHIVILPRYAPWKAALEGTGTQFVVFPSQRGGFCAQNVPAEENAEKKTYLFPEAWAGKSEDELPKVSGIATLNFCHNGRFMISAATEEDVVKACRLAREIAREEEGSAAKKETRAESGRAAD